MKIKINSISYYLPVHSESTESLKDDNPDWDIKKTFRARKFLKKLKKKEK